MMRKVVT